MRQVNTIASDFIAQHLNRDVAIVGRSCRVPGAASVAAFWRMLVEGRCAVTSIPPDRWPLSRSLHPRVGERGRTYTWAAGVLDDIWSFDPSVFGISPREAEQMDPQQRLLLELTWEALEDAGIRPSRLAGSDAGVFVGASAVDHANLRMLDMSAADAYMMTGNTLSILSNRLSYVFDLHGPSFTIDTACSSSLVAINEAVANLRSGRIDTAIVGGVSLLVAPQSFVGFSQAAMLSQRGLCQPFSANADGYVRAEGGVVLVLKTREAAVRDGNCVHAYIAECSVNSDGRTNGISLPSEMYQTKLLEDIYRGEGLSPDSLAFVETHGTGTPVGDPIEAAAIGAALGRSRSAPLLIGSVKSNIGHMEAASGLAGLLKAMLALEHDQLPPSLHSETLNSAIDFAGLNLDVVHRLTPLARPTKTRRLAGVNSFGFGGTNAHVTLTDGPQAAAIAVATAPSYLVLSAQSRSALADLVTDYAVRLSTLDDERAMHLMAATAHRRDRLAHRVVVPVGSRADVGTALQSLRVSNEEVAGAARGVAIKGASRVAFVFSGNGSQFVGMGRVAYVYSSLFRSRLDEISAAFAALAGWSIVDMLHGDDLAERLKRTQIAQPLLYAIQSAICHTLRHHGLEPDFVLGHSVGEVAAAEAAGILNGAQALNVIFARSQHQELAHNLGSMAVVIGARSAVDAILADLPGLTLAAINSPRAYTIAGGKVDMARLPEVARRCQARVRKLDLDYPFHSDGMAPAESPLLRDLANLAPRPSIIPFLSTVTGTVLDQGMADARYWWRNVREPVRFSDAIDAAVKGGVRVFIEIGPTPTLLSHIHDTIDERDATIVTITSLDRRDRGVDPLLMTVATAIARGAYVDEAKAYGSGPDAGGDVPLPLYPWQRTVFRLPETPDALGGARVGRWHPLIGARIGAGDTEWRSCLDTMCVASLGDHQIGGRAIVPGAAFVEMALAIARDWLDVQHATISDLEISSPMPLEIEASRDVASRVSVTTGQIDIASRPRLSDAPWQSHATAKIVRDTTVGVLPEFEWDSSLPSAAAMTGAEVYALAEQTGLQFGPAFRKLDWAAEVRRGLIAFGLVKEESDSCFGLDPARLDSCFHALVVLFPRLGGTSYVPVRFGTVMLRKPGAMITGGQIEVKRCDARVIVADILIKDDDGDVVAFIREARFQAIRMSKPVTASPTIYQRLVLATEPTAARREPSLSLSRLRESVVRTPSDRPMADHYVLLEGWTTSLALQAVRRLAKTNIINVDALVLTGRLPAKVKPWLEAMLVALERSGLCHRDHGGLHVDCDMALPEPDAILRTIAHEHPALSAELLAAASVGLAVNALLEGVEPHPIARRVVDDLETGSRHAQAAARHVSEFLRDSVGAWPKDRAMRILQIGCGPLTAELVPLIGKMQARLTIVEPDRRRLDRVRVSFETCGTFDLVERIEDCSAASFDLVISAGALRRHVGAPAFAAHIRRTMASGAIFAALEPQTSFFLDLALGLDACLDDDASRFNGWSGIAPDWRHAMRAAGLGNADVEEVAFDAGTGLLLTGQVDTERRHWSSSGSALIVGDDSCRTQTTFATLLASAGLHVSIVRHEDIEAAHLAEAPSTVVSFARMPEASDAPEKTVLDQCMRLKRLVEDLGQKPTRLWLVGPSAGRDDACDADIAAALWAFSRTIANERPFLEIHRVDVVADMRSELLADRLRDLVLSETSETDIVISQNATCVVRLVTDVAPSGGRLKDKVGQQTYATCLTRSDVPGLDRMSWHAARRRAPGRGEVEIVVEATGVNFRDVMLDIGLLPEDMLENGFAGPGLGLECAGRIARVGVGVKGLKRGDKIMAFARNAFTTHVTTPAALVAATPAGVVSEAAATIPVAFLTAYYALMSCARLKAGEWVLIHGGAGGVGLAALQIAQWRGARVIATAGSPEKRALLTMLGADHVFDSRSGAFVDDVRRITANGVAVVLNSLSGEAMERSIATLRPFGRFVELGKRDYAANTHIGLRPFRRNLSYFGVDLDQLLAAAPSTGRRLMRSLGRLFAGGTLVPLPYRTFEAGETAEAFRLMRQSGHIGKLVVRPPWLPPSVGRRQVRFKASSIGLHLVTGGFGGFGLETARWLAAAGARHILLVGRSGASSQEARDTLVFLAAQGVRVEAVALDIADKAALQPLFARFGRDLPPLRGVVHAAMILDDALLANVTAASMERVLRPKIAGADNLDQLTKGTPLDYFILYSSATTLIGNPGQAAYVAANGYIEGLARRRRRAGLPGLAIAWGAIKDVGVLARAQVTREVLETRAGVKALTARDALNYLGDVLALPSLAPEDAVVAIAPIDWSLARTHLPLLASPTYRNLESGKEAETSAPDIDLRVLLATTSSDAARGLVGGLVTEEIARVLRLPREDVARNMPLSDIGLDSLMTVELALGLASRLTLEAPLAGNASGLTVNELTDHIIGQCARRPNVDEDAGLAQMMMERHLGDVGQTSEAKSFAESATRIAIASRRVTRLLN